MVVLGIALGGGLLLEHKRDAALSVLPVRVSVEAIEYHLEIADSDEERALGLGGRESLCEYCAMLFVFGQAGKHGFWMKGMRFPLDIVWLRGDRVVHIERALTTENDTEVYSPSEAADRVLEFNAGAVPGLKVGERMQFLLH